MADQPNGPNSTHECYPGQLYLDTISGKMYSCSSGNWTAVTVANGGVDIAQFNALKKRVDDHDMYFVTFMFVFAVIALASSLIFGLKRKT